MYIPTSQPAAFMEPVTVVDGRRTTIADVIALPNFVSVGVTGAQGVAGSGEIRPREFPETSMRVVSMNFEIKVPFSMQLDFKKNPKKLPWRSNGRKRANQ